MARDVGASGRIYRAVVTRTEFDGTVSTQVFGGYDTPGPAKGAITSAKHQGTYRSPYRDPAYAKVTGVVEFAEIVWQPMPGEAA